MEKNSMLCGGWNIEPIVIKDGKLPEKLASGYCEAFLNWCGMRIEPLLYCGNQYANGTNHMFICEGTGVGTDNTKVIAKVILHETFPEEGQLVGHFSVSNITTLVEDKGLEGGWSIKPTGTIPADILEGMANAMQMGAGYRPLLYCASAVTNGTNHYLICEGSLATRQNNAFIASVVLHSSVGEPKEWMFISSDYIINPIFRFDANSNAAMAQAPAMTAGQPSYYRHLNNEDRAVFQKAMKNFVGVGYRPLAVSTQVINGTMRIYLCEAVAITAGFGSYLANVYVAELFDGTISMEKIANLIESAE